MRSCRAGSSNALKMVFPSACIVSLIVLLHILHVVDLIIADHEEVGSLLHLAEVVAECESLSMLLSEVLLTGFFSEEGALPLFTKFCSAV